MITCWHSRAIFYHKRVLTIDDSSLLLECKIFDSCTGIQLIKLVIKTLHNTATNHTITEIWIAEGGNDGKMCQEMTKQWIFDEIEAKRDIELRN